MCVKHYFSETVFLFKLKHNDPVEQKISGVKKEKFTAYICNISFFFFLIQCVVQLSNMLCIAIQCNITPTPQRITQEEETPFRK